MSRYLFSEEDAKKIRRLIIKMSFSAQVAHVPSALSMCDYLGVAFELITPDEFRFVLGKPFGAQAYYSLFSHYGWLQGDLSDYGSMASEWRYIIQREHPLVTYIDETMGNCLSVACGIAMAGRKAFVNISDAAFQEGTIWESALFAGVHKLSNIVMLVDNNNMQALGKTSSILDLGSLEDKLLAFGWAVLGCDGHNLQSIRNAIADVMSVRSMPHAIVCHTIKGKGVSFMEENLLWHYKVLCKQEYELAMAELV